MRVFIIAAIAAVLFLTPAHATNSDGLAALKRGDYVTAHMEFLGLAEQGNATAQHNLAYMYYYGLGVDQNPVEAVKWYRAAAEQDFAAAQFALGIIFEFGIGLPRDLVQAHRWYNLAAKNARPGRDPRALDRKSRSARQAASI